MHQNCENDLLKHSFACFFFFFHLNIYLYEYVVYSLHKLFSGTGTEASFDLFDLIDLPPCFVLWYPIMNSAREMQYFVSNIHTTDVSLPQLLNKLTTP